MPTVFFSKTNITGFQCDPYPSTTWQRVLSRALQSDTLIGWNAPVGCGSACNYTIQYPAPALRCTELGIDEVNTLVPSNNLIVTMYNATHNMDNTTAIPANLSMAWRTTYNGKGETTVAGARCALYNTTQQAVVSFVNNTGIISPSIISYHSLIEFAPEWYSKSLGGCIIPQDGYYPPQRAYLDTYISLLGWLYNQLEGSLAIRLQWYSLDRHPTSFNLVSSNLFSLNETAGTLTTNSVNVTNALEQILVNVTIALITYWGQTTTVDASVAQDQLVWVYHVQRLWIIYATALALTMACGAVGLACILKNGEDRDLTFWDIVRVTRNSELDAIVEGEKCGDARKDTMLQYAVQGRDLRANTLGVFVLARPRHKGSN